LGNKKGKRIPVTFMSHTPVPVTAPFLPDRVLA